MTDAPFTETHRATLDQWLTNPLAVIKSPDLPLDDAIRAALTEIDRLETERNQIEQKSMEWCHATQEARAEIDRLHAENGLLRRSLEMLVKDTARGVTTA